MPSGRGGGLRISSLSRISPHVFTQSPLCAPCHLDLLPRDGQTLAHFYLLSKLGSSAPRTCTLDTLGALGALGRLGTLGTSTCRELTWYRNPLGCTHPVGFRSGRKCRAGLRAHTPGRAPNQPPHPSHPHPAERCRNAHGPRAQPHPFIRTSYLCLRPCRTGS
jgi:hypothetical protein